MKNSLLILVLVLFGCESNPLGMSDNWPDGDIEINPLPGATYSWSNGSIGTYISGLSAGTYTVIATDGTCSDTLSVTVGEPSPIVATMLIGNESSAGAMDGQIDLSVSGGTPCITQADLFVSVAGGNGQSGNAFNLINTSGGDLVISGFSQGPGSGNTSQTAVPMEVWMYPADYTTNMAMSGWTQVGSATVDLTSGLTTGYIPVSGVTIPAGGTYGFIVASTTVTVQYTNGSGTVGVTPWASDANLTVTEGHGGTFAGSVDLVNALAGNTSEAVVPALEG